MLCLVLFVLCFSTVGTVLCCLYCVLVLLVLCLALFVLGFGIVGAVSGIVCTVFWCCWYCVVLFRLCIFILVGRVAQSV